MSAEIFSYHPLYIALLAVAIPVVQQSMNSPQNGDAILYD